jgi:hypothetical protein
MKAARSCAKAGDAPGSSAVAVVLGSQVCTDQGIG